jgi:hypothetical protein
MVYPLHSMNQSYQKECMYCKQQITMSDESGKWLPYNKDGSSHDCRNNNNKDKKEAQKQEPSIKEKGKEFTLEEVRKKLESIGIIINIERLMGLGSGNK